MFAVLTDYKTQKKVLVNFGLVIRSSQFSERQGKEAAHVGSRLDTVATNSNVRDGSAAVFTVDVRETVEEIEELLRTQRSLIGLLGR